MEFLKDPSERNRIHHRIEGAYLERLSMRSRQLRKLLHERKWAELRYECRQIRRGCENHGLSSLAIRAAVAESAIAYGTGEGEAPNYINSVGRISRAGQISMPEAREALEILIFEIEKEMNLKTGEGPFS